MSGKPSWLALDTEERNTDFEYGGHQQQQQQVRNPTQTLLHGVVMTERRRRTLWWGMKVVTILLCFFQIMTAITGLTLISGVGQLGKVLTAIYMYTIDLINMPLNFV